MVKHRELKKLKKNIPKTTLGDKVESELIGKIEQLAALYEKCGIHYHPVRERTGYLGLEIIWKK